VHCAAVYLIHNPKTLAILLLLLQLNTAAAAAG